MLITCWCALSVERKCGILIKVISCSANGYFINYYFRDFNWKRGYKIWLKLLLSLIIRVV